MIKSRAALFAPVAFALSVAAANAAPRADQINAMQARIDPTLEAKAANGPTAKEGVPAGMSVQPTPTSIAAAEERLGDILPQTAAASAQGMAHARETDLASRAFAAARTAKQQCMNSCRARYRDCRHQNQLPSSECQGIYQDCTRYTCTGLGPG
jgi:hypothetical protein